MMCNMKNSERNTKNLGPPDIGRKFRCQVHHAVFVCASRLKLIQVWGTNGNSC